MTRKWHRRSSIGLTIAMLFFLTGIAFRLSGYEFVSKVLMCIFVIVFFGTYFITIKVISNFNRKAWNRYKNKKEIFTESLLDDDDENHPIK